MGKVSDQAYIPYRYNKKSPKASCQEDELIRPQAQEYDELPEPANSNALGAENLERLTGLQPIIDIDYIDGQKALAGNYAYVDRDGAFCVKGSMDRKVNVKTGLLEKPDGNGKPTGKHPKRSAELTDDVRRALLCAMQAAVAIEPAAALDLLATQLSGACSYDRFMDLAANAQEIGTDSKTGYDVPESLRTLSDEFSRSHDTNPTADSGALVRKARSTAMGFSRINSHGHSTIFPTQT